MNRGTNEHISNSIWERKINTVCTHHNIDINHLHTLEKQQQRAELKRRMQTSRTQMLLKDNQNKSKTKNIMLHRDASNIMRQPKYMTTLNRGVPRIWEGGGAKNFFFQIWEFACREATCCAWRSHAHC